MRTGKLFSDGNRTDTGVVMTPERALAYHAWFRAMVLIATKCASVPKSVQKVVEKRHVPDPDNPLNWLISRQANEEQTAFDWLLQMTGHMASRGNGYSVIYQPQGNGPMELIPMDPDKTAPFRDKGELWYMTWAFGAKKGYELRAKDVIHFRGAGFDGLVGYPIWKVAAGELGIATAQRKMEGSTYKNSGRPSMILQTDMRLTPKTRDRIRDDWERLYTGLDNSGKTAILDGGLKATPISLKAEDMQQSAASQMSIVAISNFTGIPVSKLGGTKNFASQEQEERAFISDALDFYLNLQDDQLAAKLFSEEQRRKGYIIVSNREAVVWPDIKSKYDVLRTAVAGKPIMTQNEAREEIDLPPIKEEDADKLLIPLNMGQGGKANEPKDNADDSAGRPKKDDASAQKGEDMARTDKERIAATIEAARYGLSYSVARMLARIGNQAEKACGKGLAEFSRWAMAFAETNRNVVNSEFAPAERMIAAIRDYDESDGYIGSSLLAKLNEDWGTMVAEWGQYTSPTTQVQKIIQAQKLTLPEAICNKFLSVKQEGDK